MFNEVIKLSYFLSKKNINLSQHLFLFFIIVTIVAPNVSGLLGGAFILIFFTFFCAFCAGWFNAFRVAYDNEMSSSVRFVNKDNDSVILSKISKNDDDDNEKMFFPPMYFKEFFEGVGKYFIKFLTAGVIYILFFGIIFYLLNLFITHFVSIPDAVKSIDINSLSVMTQEQLDKIIFSLSHSEKIKIMKIAMLISSVCIFGSYLTLLFPIVLVSSDKNAFLCFFDAIKSLFKNIPVTILIFIIFSLLLFILSIGFSTPQNIIILIFSFILYCYLSVFYYMTLFVYYEKTK